VTRKAETSHIDLKSTTRATQHMISVLYHSTSVSSPRSVLETAACGFKRSQEKAATINELSGICAWISHSLRQLPPVRHFTRGTRIVLRGAKDRSPTLSIIVVAWLELSTVFRGHPGIRITTPATGTGTLEPIL
jgi:hypothetical protein